MKYELIAMVSHMIAMLKSQSFPQHPIVPVSLSSDFYLSPRRF